MRTKTTAAEDLKVGDRLAQVIYGDADDGSEDTYEVSTVEFVQVDPHGGTGCTIRARREVVPEGISPTWTLGASYWDEFEVVQ